MLLLVAQLLLQLPQLLQECCSSNMQHKAIGKRKASGMGADLADRDKCNMIAHL